MTSGRWQRKKCVNCGEFIYNKKSSAKYCKECALTIIKDYQKRLRLRKKIKQLKKLVAEQVESAMDGFFNRIRLCKYCKTSTKFDVNSGRYCPKGCFRGEIKN